MTSFTVSKVPLPYGKELNGVNFNNTIIDTLQDNFKRFVPAKTNREKNKAALAAVTARNMPIFIANAFRKGKPIDGSMFLNSGLNPLSIEDYSKGQIGYFMEDLHVGYKKDKTSSLADFNNMEISQQLSGVDAEIQANQNKIRQDTLPIMLDYTFDDLSGYLSDLSEGTGTEAKTYSSLTYGLKVGQFTVKGEQTQEKLLEGAFKKLFEKMNILYLMSTRYAGAKDKKKIWLQAANLFQELIFDRVVVGFSAGLIEVDVLSTDVNAVDSSTGEIGTASYEIRFNWNKLDDFLVEVVDVIKGQYVQMARGTAGHKMSETQIYEYNDLLYPGSSSSPYNNFFTDVLKYYYAQTGRYIITKK